jgi:hypothetical protein
VVDTLRWEFFWSLGICPWRRPDVPSQKRPQRNEANCWGTVIFKTVSHNKHFLFISWLSRIFVTVMENRLTLMIKISNEESMN